MHVSEPSPHRVQAPCPLAHPGGCGGCDFQHVELAEQRRLKASVVAEQLSRLAGLEREVVVEPVPATRTGVLAHADAVRASPRGDKGLRKHRSHDVVLVDRCLIAHPDAREPDRSGPVVEQVETSYGAHSFTVAGDGFWQVHPGAPRVLVETVMRMLPPSAGERALDLYAGVGLFSAFLAEAVGPTGSVPPSRATARPSSLPRQNLAGRPHVSVARDRVDRAMHRLARSDDREPVDLVVLDPPRAGAKRQVVRAIVDLPASRGVRRLRPRLPGA